MTATVNEYRQACRGTFWTVDHLPLEASRASNLPMRAASNNDVKSGLLMSALIPFSPPADPDGPQRQAHERCFEDAPEVSDERRTFAVFCAYGRGGRNGTCVQGMYSFRWRSCDES